MTPTDATPNAVTEDNVGDLNGENKTRWFSTSVEIFDHPVLNVGPFDRRSAWQWLIANAAWKTKRVNHKGKMIDLDRGQVIIGRAFLAETWGWSEQTVRTFVKILVAENMLEINQSGGHFANIATICNYDKYQARQPERNQSINQSATSVQPVSNQTLTRNTNTTNKKITTPAREKPVSGRAFWANAISAPPSPEIHPHVGVTIDDSGAISLHNEFERFWLNRFGGNADRLGLALIQIAAYVQANSGRPLEAQVGSQLARIVGEKLDRDDRAAKSKFSGGRPATADFRSQLEAI